MTPSLGTDKSAALNFYIQAVYDNTVAEVEAIKNNYTETQANYLSKFPNEQLYRAYSCLDDSISSSQGAESRMSAALRNDIRCVQPQQMMWNVIHSQRRAFLKQKPLAMSCEKPLTPYVESKFGSLITEAKRHYLSTVQWIEGSAQMEATVCRTVNPNVKRHVKMPYTSQTPLFVVKF